VGREGRGGRGTGKELGKGEEVKRKGPWWGWREVLSVLSCMSWLTRTKRMDGDAAQTQNATSLTGNKTLASVG